MKMEEIVKPKPIIPIEDPFEKFKLFFKDKTDEQMEEVYNRIILLDKELHPGDEVNITFEEFKELLGK